MITSSILILEDGTTFHGESIGNKGIVIGEIVFNTAMTGYQEILTDPSYTEQIITFTYPHIGNVGINQDDEESSKICVKGVILKNLSPIASNFRSKENLYKYLKKNKIVAISNIDTRKLTRILRKKGNQFGCIYSKKIKYAETILEKIKIYKKYNLKKKKINIHNEKIYTIPCEKKKIGYHVVIYDFGVKKNIIRILIKMGFLITLVPYQKSAETILSLKPSGILLSNGPGDPRKYEESIKNTKKLLKYNIPIFGICLGLQIIALAIGAKIEKLKFGHHGSNHPVKNINNKKIYITSQNHNFFIKKNSLPKKTSITHISLFDKTIQGISLKNNMVFGFQGHPEGCPGTYDIQELFDIFLKKIYIKENLCLKEMI